MRPLTKALISMMLGLSLLAPVAANAAGLTNDQVTAIVSILQSFGADSNTINHVQMVLMGQTGSTTLSTQNSSMMGMHPMATSTPPGMMPPGHMPQGVCVALTRDLTLGSKGDDVKQLQEALSANSSTGFTATPTGFFGPATAKAVASFQMMNGIASSTNGRVGPLTRDFLEHTCTAVMSNSNGTHLPMMATGAAGTITANTGSSITVQNYDGKSILVNITASTTIEILSLTNGSSTATMPMQTVGSSADLLVGKAVIVEGSTNIDGSINALHIHVGTLPPLQSPNTIH